MARRRAPAFLRYAADSQVAPQHRLSLAEHGLLALMRDCQWLSEDDTVPADAGELAWLVRRPVEEVCSALPAVLNLGVFAPSSSGALFDPQLRAYKAKVKDLSEKRSRAGEKGNEAKKDLSGKGKTRPRKIRANADANADATLTPTPTPTPTRFVGSANVHSLSDDPFVKDMEREEAEMRHARRVA